MEKLIEKLKEFERSISNVSSEEELQKSFENLAPAFFMAAIFKYVKIIKCISEP